MAQSLARLWTHLIFSTKDRFPFLSDKAIRADLHAYLATVLRTHECETLLVSCPRNTWTKSGSASPVTGERMC